MKNNICKCSAKSRRLLLLILSAIYIAASVVSLLIAFSEDAFLHFIGDRLYIILYLLFTSDIFDPMVNLLSLVFFIVYIIFRIVSYCLVLKKTYMPFAIGTIIDAVFFYALYLITTIGGNAEVELYPIFGLLINLIFAAIYILIAKVKRKNDEIVKGD